jgi:hypothetical protein
MVKTNIRDSTTTEEYYNIINGVTFYQQHIKTTVKYNTAKAHTRLVKRNKKILRKRHATMNKAV